MLFRQSNSTIKSLLLSSSYNFTAKSSRQTTPLLFQNPKLTKHGLIQKIPKSYDYNIPQNLQNKRLYWNRTIQNKARRVQYNAHKLQKLRIKSIHSQGKRTFQRTLPEILHQISNVRLIKASVNRTFANLSEVLIRFRNQLSPEDRQIVIQTIQDIHRRFLSTLSNYYFSSYCQIRALAGLSCTEQIFVHFYKFIQQASEMSQAQNPQPVKKFKFKVFLKVLKYIFANKNVDYLIKNQQMLYKNREMFKLFEDNDPRFISFQELVPHIYRRQQISNDLNQQQVKKNLKYLRYLPGGQKLYQNLGL